MAHGDIVSFALPNVVATIAAAAAISRIGAISNPIVTLYRENELAYVIDQLQPAAVIRPKLNVASFRHFVMIYM